MTPEKLVGMANQIADNFRAYGEAKAAADIRNHLVAFWTPAMLDTLEAHIAGGAPEVDGLVVRAMRLAAA